jgi:hypothetical protein
MRTKRTLILAVSFLVLAFLALAAPAPSHAQTPASGEDWQQVLDQCLEDQTGPILEPPTLVSDGMGGWRCVASGQGGSSLGWIIPFMLLWAALPMVIAGVVASSRGESVGLALALTFFLGWLGFAIVLFGMRRSAASVRAALEPETSTGPPGPSIADRLQTLDDLRDRGLITDDEYEARRERILSET